MIERLPSWIKAKRFGGKEYASIMARTSTLELHTVCDSAMCPNRGECYNNKTATLMILGNRCTRNCSFCAVEEGNPLPPNPNEPTNVAKFVAELKLKHVVITSVTRDDLPDGGAAHFAATINAIKSTNPHGTVEVLIPDFKGDIEALKVVVAAKPSIINHNIETVARLYSVVRPQAIYERSLQLISNVRALNSSITTKTGLMAGLGETEYEVVKTMKDLYQAGCQMLTIGQYLRPTTNHLPVKEYIRPDVFEKYRQIGLGIGFKNVFSAPMVRSSYHADETFVETK